jgi:hypothetical protein
VLFLRDLSFISKPNSNLFIGHYDLLDYSCILSYYLGLPNFVHLVYIFSGSDVFFSKSFPHLKFSKLHAASSQIWKKSCWWINERSIISWVSLLFMRLRIWIQMLNWPNEVVFQIVFYPLIIGLEINWLSSIFCMPSFLFKRAKVFLFLSLFLHFSMLEIFSCSWKIGLHSFFS